MSFTVLGTGSKLPDTVVTNDDLATFLDTSDRVDYHPNRYSQTACAQTRKLIDLATVAAKMRWKTAA